MVLGNWVSYLCMVKVQGGVHHLRAFRGFFAQRTCLMPDQVAKWKVITAVCKNPGENLCALSLTPSISSKKFISSHPLECCCRLPMPNLDGGLLLLNKVITLGVFFPPCKYFYS